jgi:16S rRNA (guanine966-N2)-methyltransferase
LRIVGGRLRGLQLADPGAGDPGAHLRPTLDRVREAIFNVLVHDAAGDRVQGARVLDLFAGTGALGLEALSRGAAHAHFIERDRAALAALRANVAALGASATVHAGDATRPPPGVPCGLVFLDPPYGQGLVERALAALEGAGWLAEGALVVAETGRDEALAPWGEVLAERSHGAARVTVMRKAR